MKRLVSLGLLAGCIVLASERPAQAWVNSKFSVGLNWNYQSGNNTLLWGLFRNGQAPCFDCGPACGPMSGPGPGGPGVESFPYAGAAMAPSVPAYAMPQQGPTRGDTQQAGQFGAIPSYNGANYYQNDSYPGPAAPSGYTAPPGYGYYPGYYNAPSYWYGQ